MAQLELQNVTKDFKTGRAVDGLSLAVEPGEIVAVFGPSGGGKTVLLRIISGIEEPEGGRVYIGGRDATADAPEARGVGIAFQNFALFPHMSARDNIMSGLTALGRSKADMEPRVAAVAKMLKIDHVMGHRPRELSNGQKQRTALARALVAEPMILLLDDPLRNVDAKLRYEMRLELPNLLRRTGSAVLYVTQDYKEAMALADRIVVMLKGRIVQSDRPEVVYDSPATIDIARLFGDPTINLLPVQPARGLRGASVTIANTQVSVGQGYDDAIGRACTIGLRPEELTLQEGSGDDAVPVDLMATTPLNERVVTMAKTLDGHEILASAVEPPLGGRHTGRAYLRVNPETVLLFDAASGDRIQRSHSPAAREKRESTERA